MLRDEEPGRKASAAPCPNCGAAGNYAHHGHYHRHFDDGGGERLVRIERVRCLSCGRTHALIWRDMVPHKLRSESSHLRAFRSWAHGRSMRSLLESTAIPRTSLRRMISHVKTRVRLLLACGPSRAALSAAIDGIADATLSSMHLAEYGRMLAEGVRIGCARARPAPPAGPAT